MPVKLLDPTLDIVFKLLLLRNTELLRDMIEAVLSLQTPIESVQVLNPEIPQNSPSDKEIALDLRLRRQREEFSPPDCSSQDRRFNRF